MNNMSDYDVFYGYDSSYADILQEWQELQQWLNESQNTNCTDYSCFFDIDTESPLEDSSVPSGTVLTIRDTRHYPDTASCNIAIQQNITDWTQLAWVRNVFIAGYILVILLSLVGNMMVIITVCHNKHMRTVTNYYILNLAVCDFIVALVVMPVKLLEYTAPCSWHVLASDTVCRVCTYLFPVVVFASVLTLTAISIAR